MTPSVSRIAAEAAPVPDRAPDAPNDGEEQERDQERPDDRAVERPEDPEERVGEDREDRETEDPRGEAVGKASSGADASIDAVGSGPLRTGCSPRAFCARRRSRRASRESASRAAEEPPGRERFEAWIDAGRHAGMRYLEETRTIRAVARGRSCRGARSVVCLAAPHSAAPWVGADGSRFARYARGADYHGVAARSAPSPSSNARAERLGGGWASRVCVDSTPIAERSFAAAAGLGWIGKNGCLIDAEHGSYLLLAEILTDLDLPPDAPMAEQCGSCTRCLDACPTGAFLEPGLLDAGRCLAYWTIEHRGADPRRVEGGARRAASSAATSARRSAPGTRRSSSPPPDSPPPPTRAEILGMGRGAWRPALRPDRRRPARRGAASSATPRPRRAPAGTPGARPALEAAARVEEAGLADAARWALDRIGRLPL